MSSSSSSSSPTTYSKENPAVIAAVECGGTSFVVAICHLTSNKLTDPPVMVEKTEVDSSHGQPAKTLQECASFLQQHRPAEGYHALGIASFGPLGVHADSAAYGCILKSSPKQQWRGVDLLTPLQKACQGGTRPLAVKVETDVNAPAMAEYLLDTSGSGNNNNNKISSLAYITVGTGIGVGLVVNGQCVHGRMHPEGGHVPIIPLPNDPFTGYSWNDTSPFGGRNTVEGIACSVALTERYQQRQANSKQQGSSSDATSRSVLATLDDDDEVWDHAANALANLCATLLLTLSMEKIVLGGGLMNRKCLLAKIQQRTLTLLNGYLELPPIDQVIVTSEYGNQAGLHGTMVLAQTALLEDNNDATKEMKQTAFATGLWHGMLVGAVGAALVCKYTNILKSSSRR